MERSTGCLIAALIGPVLFVIVGIITAIVGPPDRQEPTDIATEPTQAIEERHAQEDSSSVQINTDEPSEQEDQEVEPRPSVAGYEILEDEDISYSVIVRRNYRIVSPTMQADQVRITAQEIIDRITQEDTDIDAISLLFYSDPSVIYGSYDVAMVEWVPNGEWADITAEIARKNDRSSYELNIEYGEGLEE